MVSSKGARLTTFKFCNLPIPPVVQSSAGPSDAADGRGLKRKAEDSDSEPEPEDNVR